MGERKSKVAYFYDSAPQPLSAALTQRATVPTAVRPQHHTQCCCTRRPVEGRILWRQAPHEAGARRAPSSCRCFILRLDFVAKAVVLRAQVRLDMAHHLILAYELHKDMDVYVRLPASPVNIQASHSSVAPDRRPTSCSC